MAGHLLITDKYVGETESETQAVRKLVKDVRADLREIRETGEIDNFESKYKDLPRDYFEEGDTSVVVSQVEVPESIVWGGRASLETHLRGTGIKKIYLVA